MKARKTVAPKGKRAPTAAPKKRAVKRPPIFATLEEVVRKLELSQAITVLAANAVDSQDGAADAVLALRAVSDCLEHQVEVLDSLIAGGAP